MALMCLGVLFLQVCWVFATPPFAGSDEFDHAFRAAAVANGQWVADPTDATRGTGAWLHVPEHIVDAARAECQALPYTGPEDCVGEDRGDYVRIASGAGRYNPAYYVAVGYPALPFQGTTALYVMRFVTVLTSWGLFVLAMCSIRTWARSSWPFVGAVVSMTPILVYSTSVTAPNGVELMAGLGLWSSLVGLATLEHARHDRFLILVATLSASVLVTLRSLGPVWCLMIAAAVLLAVPMTSRRAKQLFASRWTRGGAVSIGTATALSAWWILAMHSLVIGVEDNGDMSFADKLGDSLKLIPLWVLQSIAAFPIRNQPSPPIVYATYLAVGLAFTLHSMRRSDIRLRLGLVFVMAAAALFPFAVTFATIEKFGTSWQGRYGLPFSLGLFILAGYGLDRAKVGYGYRSLIPCALLLVASHVIGISEMVHRLDLQRDEARPALELIAIGGIAGCAVLTVFYGALGVIGPRTSRSHPSQSESARG